MSEEDRKPTKKKKHKKRIKCVHDYAYCYYSTKDRENVYRCVDCGRWSYQ